MSDAATATPARGCPHCGAPLSVGFIDFLPSRWRKGPVRFQCDECLGWSRLAPAAQIAAVVALIVALAGGAIVTARAADSDQAVVIVLALSLAGALLLSYVAGYAFLRFQPDGERPSATARRLEKRRRR